MKTLTTSFLRSQTAPFRSLVTLFVIVILSFCACVMFTGCAHERIVLRHAQTNDVEVLTTNAVPVVTEAETVRTELNPIPGLPEIRTTNLVTLTNWVTRVETNVLRVITPEVAYTNLSLNPAVGAAVEVAGATAPVPWAGTAAGIFGTITGGIFGLINSRRRKAALGEAQTWQETAKVLVENVEAVRKQALALPGYTQEIDRKVVRGIETAQRVAGVKDRVHALVEEFTDDTLPPDPSGAPAPVERSKPGQPANRPLSELVAFAKTAATPKRGDFSDSDILSIMEIRGQA